MIAHIVSRQPRHTAGAGSGRGFSDSLRPWVARAWVLRLASLGAWVLRLASLTGGRNLLTWVLRLASSYAGCSTAQAQACALTLRIGGTQTRSVLTGALGLDRPAWVLRLALQCACVGSQTRFACASRQPGFSDSLGCLRTVAHTCHALRTGFSDSLIRSNSIVQHMRRRGGG